MLRDAQYYILCQDVRTYNKCVRGFFFGGGGVEEVQVNSEQSDSGQVRLLKPGANHTHHTLDLV